MCCFVRDEDREAYLSWSFVTVEYTFLICHTEIVTEAVVVAAMEEVVAADMAEDEVEEVNTEVEEVEDAAMTDTLIAPANVEAGEVAPMVLAAEEGVMAEAEAEEIRWVPWARD